MEHYSMEGLMGKIFGFGFLAFLLSSGTAFAEIVTLTCQLPSYPFSMSLTVDLSANTVTEDMRAGPNPVHTFQAKITESKVSWIEADPNDHDLKSAVKAELDRYAGTLYLVFIEQGKAVRDRTTTCKKGKKLF